MKYTGERTGIELGRTERIKFKNRGEIRFRVVEWREAFEYDTCIQDLQIYGGLRISMRQEQGIIFVSYWLKHLLFAILRFASEQKVSRKK